MARVKKGGNLADMIKDLKGVKTKMNRSEKKLANELGQLALYHLRYLTPVDTGALVKSWAYEFGNDGLIIYSPLHYAKYVEWGTRDIPGRYMMAKTFAIVEKALPGLAENYMKAVFG